MLVIGICVVCINCKEAKTFKKAIQKNRNFRPCEQQTPFGLSPPKQSNICPDRIAELSVRIYNVGLPGIYEIRFPDGTIKTTEEVYNTIDINHKFSLECDNMPGSPTPPNDIERYFTYDLNVRRIDCAAIDGTFFEVIAISRIAPNPLNGIIYSPTKTMSFPHTIKFMPEICNQYLVKDYQWYVDNVSVGDSSILDYSFEREGTYNIKLQVTNHFECNFSHEQEVFVGGEGRNPYIFVSKPFSLNPTPMKRLESEFINDSSEVASPPLASNNSNSQNPPPVSDDEPLIPTFEMVPEVVDYIAVGSQVIFSETDSQIINEKRGDSWLNSLCNDGIKNGNETGVDCGGSCSPCRDSVSVESIKRIELSELPSAQLTLPIEPSAVSFYINELMWYRSSLEELRNHVEKFGWIHRDHILFNDKTPKEFISQANALILEIDNTKTNYENSLITPTELVRKTVKIKKEYIDFKSNVEWWDKAFDPLVPY